MRKSVPASLGKKGRGPWGLNWDAYERISCAPQQYLWPAALLLAELLVFLAPLESTCVDTKMAVWRFVLFCVARSRTRTTTHLYVNRFAVASQCTHTSEPVHTVNAPHDEAQLSAI